MNLIEYLHAWYVHRRRVSVLSSHVASVLPRDAEVLDVGCGDGLLASLIIQQRPDVRLQGIDILPRPDTHIRVDLFDGTVLPFLDKSFDVVMFVDVLHHTHNPIALLHEALRVARKTLVIKDHTRDGLFAEARLRWMDYIGNARHGISLPHKYWPEKTWLDVFNSLNLDVVVWRRNLKIYPAATRWVFDRSLHFLACVEAKGG